MADKDAFNDKDNAQARHSLQLIYNICLEQYPFKDGSQLDPRYAMALGLIAGTAHEALSAVDEDRQMRVKRA